MASKQSINNRASSGLRILSDPATVLLLIAVAVAILALMPEAASVTGSQAVGSAAVPAMSGDDGGRVLVDFAGDVPPLGLSTTVEYAAFVAPGAKKIAALQKKIAKQELRIAKKEARITELADEIVSWQAALVDAQLALLAAQALPETTPQELKAKNKAIKQANKAIKKATKRITKRQNKTTKLQSKIVVHNDKIGTFNDLIADFGGLPNPGLLGVAGLEVPETMSVLTATDDGVAAALAPGDFPPGSDYATDQAREFVYDPSMRPLDQVNGILCLMRQTAYDQLVNIGPYNALIDEEACGMGDDDDGGNGQSTGTTTELELWVVQSVRTDDNARHVVGFWVPGGEDEPGPGGESVETVINVRVDIEEGVSEGNPFGVFALDFAGIPVDGNPNQPMFWGTLESQPALEGFLGFSFFQESGDPQGDFYERTEAHVNMFADGTQGVARVRETYMEDFGGGPPVNGTSEYVLAFDEDNLLREKVGETEACLSRVDFETKVWRYNLYHCQGEAAGSLVDRNSGFGFETADGHHGWAGYWGLSLPHGADVQSGDTVTQHVYGNGETPQAYTVLQAPGKLIRNTRHSLPLADIDGEVFDWWEVVEDGQGQGPPIEHRYVVQYTHVDGLFRKLGEWFPGENGDTLEDLPVPEVLDTASLQWLGLWSQGLGGNVNYVHGENFVTFFEEQIVNGDDPLFGVGTTAQLFGYFDLLDTNITGVEAMAGDVFMPGSFDVLAPVPFVFQSGDLGLYHDVAGDGSLLTPVGLAPGQTYEGGPFEWGMRTGPLVTDTGLLGDVFDLWNQDVFYVWETGPNPWNRFSTLVDAEGVAISFDPPLTFTYTHALENDRNADATFAGKTFQFEYHGPGDLHGIPHTGVDIDGDGWEDRWYPDFSLEDGVVMGPNGDEFILRAIEMEQSLAEAPGACQALNIDTVGQLPLPDGSTFQLPNLGDVPLVDDPPAVIAGQVVEEGEEEDV